MTQQQENPYATPATNLHPAASPAALGYVSRKKARGIYASCFTTCAILPLLIGPWLAAFSGYITTSTILLALFISFTAGWVISVPFAATMTGIIYLLRNAGYAIGAAINFILYPVIFSVVWLCIMYLIHRFNGLLPYHYPQIKQFVIIYGIPALLSGLVTAYNLFKYSIMELIDARQSV